MVGRRQLREKIIQSVYAYEQNPKDINLVVRNLFRELNKIYDLYVFQLNLLVSIHKLAGEHIEISKHKFIKSDNDLSPNLKFVENLALQQIISNKERENYSSKNTQLLWSTSDELVTKTYQNIISGKLYRDYMKSEHKNFDEDQKFLGKLFLRYIAENEFIHSFFEDIEISWADDIHISNSLVQKTISFLKPDKETNTLIKIVKGESDESFARTLLSQTITNLALYEKKLEENLKNWDIERVSLVDKIIIITGMCEMNEFKSTPSTIIINEYIEIAKTFSSEKSNVFVNGILNKYAKDNNRI